MKKKNLIDKNNLKGFPTPRHTQTPNDFFEMAAEMDEPELRVTLVMIRHTFGWHQNSFRMSIDDLAEEAGISPNSARKGAEAAEARGTFRRSNPGENKTAMWELVIQDPTFADEEPDACPAPNEPPAPREVHGVNPCPSPREPLSPLIKENKKENIPPSAGNVPVTFGIEWHMAQDKPIDPAVLAADLQRKMLDAANLIATGQPNAQAVISLVMAFQQARGMVIPEHKYNHARKVVKNLIASGVGPEHITQATNHLLSQEKTRNSVAGIHSVENLAISYATPVPTNHNNGQTKAVAF